jgi:hypothetical protein
VLQLTGISQLPALGDKPGILVAGGPLFIALAHVAAIVAAGEHCQVVLAQGTVLNAWESAADVMAKVQSIVARSQLTPGRVSLG